MKARFQVASESMGNNNFAQLNITTSLVICRSVAHVPLLRPSAHIARHLAAPMKLASAALASLELLRAEAPPTTQQIAAVDADRRLVALAPGRAEAVLGRAAAEGGGLLEIDEIVEVGTFVVALCGNDDRARVSTSSLAVSMNN